MPERGLFQMPKVIGDSREPKATWDGHSKQIWTDPDFDVEQDQPGSADDNAEADMRQMIDQLAMDEDFEEDEEGGEYLEEDMADNAELSQVAEVEVPSSHRGPIVVPPRVVTTPPKRQPIPPASPPSPRLFQDKPFRDKVHDCEHCRSHQKTIAMLCGALREVKAKSQKLVQTRMGGLEQITTKADAALDRAAAAHQAWAQRDD